MATYVEVLNAAHAQKFGPDVKFHEGRVLPKYVTREDGQTPYMKPPPQKNRTGDGERFEREVSVAFCEFWKDIEATYQTNKEAIHDLMCARQVATVDSAVAARAAQEQLAIPSRETLTETASLMPLQTSAAVLPGHVGTPMPWVSARFPVESMVHVCATMSEEDKRQLVDIVLRSMTPKSYRAVVGDVLTTFRSLDDSSS